MSEADFVLVIQTRFQRDAFQEFGNGIVYVDTCIICLWNSPYYTHSIYCDLFPPDSGIDQIFLTQGRGSLWKLMQYYTILLLSFYSLSRVLFMCLIVQVVLLFLFLLAVQAASFLTFRPGRSVRLEAASGSKLIQGRRTLWTTIRKRRRRTSWTIREVENTLDRDEKNNNKLS